VRGRTAAYRGGAPGGTGHPHPTPTPPPTHQRPENLRGPPRRPIPVSDPRDRREAHAVFRHRPSGRTRARSGNGHPDGRHPRSHREVLDRHAGGRERARPRRTRLAHRGRRPAGADPAHGLEQLVYSLRSRHGRASARGRRCHAGQRHGRFRLPVRQYRRLLDETARRGPPARSTGHDPPEREVPGHPRHGRVHPWPRPQGRDLHLARTLDLRRLHGQLRLRGTGRPAIRGLGIRLPEVRLVLLRRGRHRRGTGTVDPPLPDHGRSPARTAPGHRPEPVPVRHGQRVGMGRTGRPLLAHHRRPGRSQSSLATLRRFKKWSPLGASWEEEFPSSLIPGSHYFIGTETS
jgi:hypothetical protein